MIGVPTADSRLEEEGHSQQHLAGNVRPLARLVASNAREHLTSDEGEEIIVKAEQIGESLKLVLFLRIAPDGEIQMRGSAAEGAIDPRKLGRAVAFIIRAI